MSEEFHFSPYTRQFSQDPYRVYAYMREKCPIYYHKEWDAWIFSRYEDIRALLTDERLGRTMDHIMTPEEIGVYRREHAWDKAPNHSKYVKFSILDSEAETHTRLRKAVFKIFTDKHVQRLRDFVQNLVDSRIDAIKSMKEIDFIEDFVAPIPGAVIGKMLGVPEQDRPRLRAWSEDIVQFFEPERTEEHRELAETTTIEFADYLTELIAARKQRPEEDLLSEMIQWRDKNDGLDHDELISTAMIILMAGHGSTIDVSGNGMLALLQNRKQMTELETHSELMHTAVQEMFRYDPPLPYFHRYTLEDIEYKGQLFKKGTMLGFLYASANRDGEQFKDPDSFDIRREPNRHLAFGGGIHHCLGNHLARMNMEIMFTSILQRLPKLSLAIEEEKLEYRIGCSSRGLLQLPVRLC